MKTYDITNMSNRQIEDLCHQCEVELQERRLAQEEIYRDAMTHHLFIDELSEDLRSGYHDWLKENLHHPAACDIIEAYYSDEQYKSAIKKEGA